MMITVGSRCRRDVYYWSVIDSHLDHALCVIVILNSFHYNVRILFFNCISYIYEIVYLCSSVPHHHFGRWGSIERGFSGISSTLLSIFPDCRRTSHSCRAPWTDGWWCRSWSHTYVTWCMFVGGYGMVWCAWMLLNPRRFSSHPEEVVFQASTMSWYLLGRLGITRSNTRYISHYCLGVDGIIIASTTQQCRDMWHV